MFESVGKHILIQEKLSRYYIPKVSYEGYFERCYSVDFSVRIQILSRT